MLTVADLIVELQRFSLHAPVYVVNREIYVNLSGERDTAETVYAHANRLEPCQGARGYGVAIVDSDA